MDWLVLIDFCCCCWLLSGSMPKIQKVRRQFLITKTQRSNEAMPPQLGYILPVLTSLKYVPFASFPNTFNTYYAWQVENLHYSVDVIHFQIPSITQTHIHQHNTLTRNHHCTCISHNETKSTRTNSCIQNLHSQRHSKVAVQNSDIQKWL